MKKKLKGKKSKTYKSPLNFFPLLILGLIVFGALGVSLYAAQQTQNIQQHAATPVSLLIFGTNLHLDSPNDSFITSSGFRAGLQNAKVRFIRLPIRTIGAPDATAIAAAQEIKALGASPLIILKFSQPDPVGAAVQVAQAMNTIFGTQRVYYEDGNERDLNGTNAQAYVAQWNQVAPAVKQVSPTAWIGGPANFQANPAYIAYFVHNSVPKPDFISWHWYTCNSSAPQATCIGNVSHFSGHVSATRQAITTNGDSVPPIMITEWNYAPDGGVPTDNKHNDPVFLSQWTTLALQQLIDPVNAIFASNIYDVANALPLANTNGTLTTQGQIFQQFFNAASNNGQLGGNILVPTLIPTTANQQVLPTVTANPHTAVGSVQPAVTCSSQTVKACGYTSECSNTLPGTLCERQVNDCGTSSSGANIYACTNGKWVYTKWVKTGTCNFCGAAKTSSLNAKEK